MMVSCFNVAAYNPQHVAVLKQNIAQDLPINVSGCDFRGAGTALQGINLSNAQAGNANFDTCIKVTGLPFLTEILNQKTDLTNANFSNAILRSASFNGAILKGVSFSGADVTFANFSGADLTGADFTGAVGLPAAVFCSATMPNGVSKCSGKSWTDVKTRQVFLCGCSSQK